MKNIHRELDRSRLQPKAKNAEPVERLESRLMLSVALIGGHGPDGSAAAGSFVSDGSDAYFYSVDAASPVGYSVWRTDGATDGTLQLAIPGNLAAGAPSSFTLSEGRLFFLANPRLTLCTVAPGSGDIETVKELGLNSAFDFIGLNGKFYFLGGDETGGGCDLYISDGSELGTQRLVDFTRDGDPSADLFSLARVGDRLYLGARRASGGWAVYRSDGTTQGTDLVVEIDDGSAVGYPFAFAELNGNLIFNVGSEVWVSDGTRAGSFAVGRAQEGGIASTGDIAVFPGEDASSSFDYPLWITDGTTAGTKQLDGLRVMGSNKAAVADDAVYINGRRDDGFGLFRIDAAGVSRIPLNGERPLAIDDQIYFKTAYENGIEPTIQAIGLTNGTAGGTRLVGVDDRSSEALLPVRNGVVFGRSGALYALPNDPPPLPSISGHVFVDWNLNGVRDADEPSGPYADISPNIQVSFRGEFSVKWVTPRQHALTATPAYPYYRLTTPRTAYVDSYDGQDHTDVDFGVIPFNLATGRVYYDYNNDDAITSSDGPRSGQTVYADLNRNGRLDPDEPSDVSRYDGTFSIPNLPVGAPVLIHIAPAPGWSATFPLADGYEVVGNPQGGELGPFNFAVTDKTPNNLITVTTFEDADRDGLFDAGEARAAQGLAWIDLNEDGVLDPNEPWSNRTGGTNDVILRLPRPGTYQLHVEPPAGWSFTKRPPTTVTLGTGQRILGIKAGVAPPVESGASASGVVFNDTNGDGARSESETPVAGTRVFDDLDGDGVFSAGEPAVATDSRGRFTFADQTPGRHVYRLETPTTGWVQTTPAVGDGLTVDLQPNERRSDLVFGAQLLPSNKRRTIHLSLFVDENVNGVRDADEKPPAVDPIYGRGLDFFVDRNDDAQIGIGEAGSGGGEIDNQGRTAIRELAPGRYRIRLYSVFTAVRASFGDDGSLVVNVPPDADATVSIGVYRPNAIVSDPWTESYNGFPQFHATLSDFSDKLNLWKGVHLFDQAGAEIPVGGPGYMNISEGMSQLDVGFRQKLTAGRYTLVVSGTTLHGSAGLPTPPDFTYTFDYPLPSSVVKARGAFYNNSAADNLNPAADLFDDRALAADKVALLPGQAASAANVTNYSKGLNGVMIDVAGMQRSRPLTADDFIFRSGAGGDPATWTEVAVKPIVTTRLKAGVDGSTRVFLTWPDGALVNTWLQVTMKAGERTGLAEPDVFYFGNLVADSGGANLSVDAADLVRTRNAVGSTQPTFDFDRNVVVNAADLVAARNSVGRSIAALSAAATGAPFRLDLDPASDSGVFKSDDVTNFDNRDPSRALRFVVLSTSPGARVQLFADDALIGETIATSAVTTVVTDGATRLADGVRRFGVRQLSPDGTVSMLAATLRITIDTVAPDRPAPPDLQSYADRGVSDSDNLTNAGSLPFHVESASNFQLYRDGVLISPVSAYAVPTDYHDEPQADGVYSYAMTAVDLAGNESIPSDPLEVTVDRTAPTVEASVADVTTPNAASHKFTLTFADAVGFDLATLFAKYAPAIEAPLGKSFGAQVVGVAESSDHRSATVTYRFGVVEGSLDVGDYLIRPTAFANLTDNAGNSFPGDPGEPLATFKVIGTNLRLSLNTSRAQSKLRGLFASMTNFSSLFQKTSAIRSWRNATWNNIADEFSGGDR